MALPETGYADVDGASLYYELAGTGPTLVLLHGFSFDSTIWDDQIDVLARNYRVLRYDLRGFGRSNSSEVEYTHAGDLKALLDGLRIQEAYLAGLSLGGGAVINFALTYPTVARALILVAPSLGGFNWSANFAAAQTAMQARAREKGIEAAREVWLRQIIFRHATNNKAVAERLQTMVRGYSGWHWTHADLGKPLIPPAIGRLGEIGVPTLVLVGDEDAPDHLQIAETLERAIPGAKKVVFPGLGHLVNLEEPALFNDHIIRFLETVGRGQ